MKQNKSYEIEPSDYITLNTILRVSRKECLRTTTKISSLKFKLINIQQRKLESLNIFEMTYSAKKGKYLLKQEFEKIPMILNEVIMINTICCDKHFPQLSNNDIKCSTNESCLSSTEILQ